MDIHRQPTWNVLVLLLAAVGCGRESPARSLAPSPPSGTPPATTPLVQFVEPSSGFTTSDVRDAAGHVLQFNRTGNLIWTDGTVFTGYGVAGGLTIEAQGLCACWLEVRFGIEGGERRAYLTADYGHSNRGSVIRLEVAGAQLAMTETEFYPPGTFTLSGVVTEATPNGQVPLEGVTVSRLYGSGWQDAVTDRSGFYQIHGLYARTDKVSVGKDGYATATSVVTVDGDTRYDVQLARRSEGNLR